MKWWHDRKLTWRLLSWYLKTGRFQTKFDPRTMGIPKDIYVLQRFDPPLDQKFIHALVLLDYWRRKKHKT